MNYYLWLILTSFLLQRLYYFNVSEYSLCDLLSVFTNFIIIKTIIRYLIPSSDTFDNTTFNTNAQLYCFAMLCLIGT